MMSVLAIGVGWAETVTKTIAEIATANNWSDATVYSSFSLDSHITVSCTSGNNTGKYYLSDDTWRMYANENAIITVSAAGNYTISSITFTFTVKDNGTLNYGNNSISSASPVVVSGSSASFTVSQSSGTKGKVFISEISVTYSNSGTTPSTYYLTLPSGLTGGTVTASGADDLTSITAGTEMTVTANPSTDYVLDWMKANGTVVENPYTFNIYADTEITAAFKEKPSYLFYESWSGTTGTGGNDGSWSGSIATNNIISDNTGWSFENSKGGANCIKMATGSTVGKAITPTITGLTIGTTYTLTFRAAGWNGEGAPLYISANGGTLPQSSVTTESSIWNEYTINFLATSSEAQFTFTTTNKKRTFLDDVLLEEAILPEVATPVIAGETPFLTSTEVTITCATEGTTIYYTTDGTNPTNESNESTEYVGPFEINESKTVKAIAYDANNNASTVASKEFVKTPTPSTVAEIVDLADGTTFVFNGNLVVSAQSEEYLYAQDATGGMLLYGSAPTFNKGDVIPTGFGAKKTTFKGAPELKEMTNMQNATETEQINALAITPNQVTVENAFKYAVIKGATISGNTIAVGEETVAIYNRFGVTVPTDGKTYDIYGVTGWFEGAQFMPLEFVAEAEPEYYLVGSFNQVFNEETNKYDWIQQDPNYKFTLNDDGKYVLNGVTFPDNVEFKILKVKGSQIIWCGGPADGEVYGIHGEWYKDIPLTMNGGKNYKIDAAGTFNFAMTIDNNNSSNNKFTVIKSPVVLKGSFDGWTENGVELEANDNGWVITQQLDAGENAGFGFRDGWGNWHGGNGKEIASTDLGTNLTMGTDGNFKMATAGKYKLAINSDLTTLVATRVLTPHNIVVDSDIENGTIEIKENKTTAVEGEIVTIIVTPDEGYELGALTVTNTVTQESIEVTEDYTFVMPDADVLVSGEFIEVLEAMFNFDANYATLFPTITGPSSGSGDTYVSDGDITKPVTATVDGVSLTVSPNPEGTPNRIWATSPRLRMYGGTITITAPNGYKLTGMEISQGKWNEGNTANVGTLTSTSWSGEATSVVITIAGNTQFKYMNVTCCEIPDDQVMDPVIEGETPFLESTTVTITCATEGAEIRYTLNGQDPTAESNLYTEPFTINEALTVKAIAFKNGNSSSIVSKEFKKIPRVATIAEYIDLNDNAEFVFTGDAVVTYQNGSNTWIKDETGYALIYASGQPEYNNGNVIPTGWGGKKTIYNGIPEITNVTGLENATETAEAAPVEKLVNEITASDVNAFYRISEITLSANTNNFNIVDGNNVLSGYNKFGITMPEDIEGKIFNVVGVVTLYNNGPEFYIISYEEVIEPVTLDGVAFTADRQWATWYGDANLALPEGVTAYVVTGVQGEAVAVEALDYIPANTGVLLNRETAAESVSAMPYTGEAGTIPTNLLVGSLEAQTISNAYLLYNNQFILAQDGTTVGAHRCYLPASASTQGAPRLLIGDPGTVTGIEDLRYDSNGKPIGYYDLTGRYVGTSLNGKRGIFITSDGKKVVR